ncbi:CorA family divalent cation transporter [Nonomuraea longispora]|uniref:CorA family divalent cation transporter n=1 Tax=Nonomuraea longispora TaxID=1848320 RepID=UPI001FEB3448|nr:CorA family divalent cation transporter [Nonomuraea longispora]
MALGDGTRDHFRDALDHLLRVDSQVDEHNDLLTSALSAHLTLVGRDQNKVAMQQNADMRKISAWAAVIAVPTMMAWIYGMNFDHMPNSTGRSAIPEPAPHGRRRARRPPAAPRSGWL